VSRENRTDAPQVISPAHASRVTYRDFEDDNEDKVSQKLLNPPSTLWLMLSRDEVNGAPDEHSRFLLGIVKHRYHDCNQSDFRAIKVMRCTL
jgi:hypothetical protein